MSLSGPGPATFVNRGKELVLGLAVIAMIIVAVIVLIGIPVLMRVFSEAADQDKDYTGDGSEGGSEEEDEQSGRSGRRR
jgi:hypothetical protein